MTEQHAKRLDDFYNAIVHGNAAHRKWLKEEFTKFWGVEVSEKNVVPCEKCKGSGLDVVEKYGVSEPFDCDPCDGTGRLPKENTSEEDQAKDQGGAGPG